MRLIDADALKLDIMCVYGSNPQYINWLNHAPTVDAVPVRHGKWEPFDLTWGRSVYVCTCCGNAMEVPTCMGEPMYSYCPNCGADMRGESDE